MIRSTRRGAGGAGGHRELRLRLVAGRSNLEQLDFEGGVERRSLTVGRDPQCDWWVNAEGVASLHVELSWDGEALWIRDPERVGDVAIDGDRVSTWRRVLPGTRLVFGLAMMVAEDDAADEYAEPTVASELYAEPTVASEVYDDKTVTAHRDSYPTRADIAAPSAEATIVDAPAANGPELATGEWGSAEPIAGGPTQVAFPTGLRPRLGEARQHGPVSAAETKLVEVDGAPDEELTPSLPSPVDAPARPGAVHERDTEPPAVGAIREPPSDDPAPRPAGGARPVAHPTERLAASRAKPIASRERLMGALPLRTWALLGLLVVALGGVLLSYAGGDAPSPGEAPRGAVVRAGEPVAEAPVVPVPVGHSVDEAPEPSEEAPVSARTDPEDDAPSPAEPAEALPVDEDTIAEAADLLIARKYQEALPIYERLARAQPHVSEYALVVRILRRTVREGE